MARHGENIRKRSDGRWEGRYKTYSTEREKDIYRSVYGSSYENVKRKLLDAKRLIEQPTNTVAIDFKTVAEFWLEDVKDNRKYSTWVKYKSVYEKYLLEEIGSYQITELTANLISEKIQGDFSDSIYSSIYCVINQTLTFARERYSVAVCNVRKNDKKEKKKRVEILSRKEQGKLLSVLCRDIDLYKTAVLMSFYTGMRLGEICCLKWSDIDFINGIIAINRTVQRITVSNQKSKTVLLETSPKSEYSKREIPVSIDLLRVLLKFKNNKDYIFGEDKPMEPRTLQYQFKQFLEEAGVANKKFHILRHTFATNCIEKGTDVKSLSEILGHSDVKITLNRYVHPSMEQKRRYLDRLSQIYGQISGQAY